MTSKYSEVLDLHSNVVDCIHQINNGYIPKTYMPIDLLNELKKNDRDNQIKRAFNRFGVGPYEFQMRMALMTQEFAAFMKYKISLLNYDLLYLFLHVKGIAVRALLTKGITYNPIDGRIDAIVLSMIVDKGIQKIINKNLVDEILKSFIEIFRTTNFIRVFGNLDDNYYYIILVCEFICAYDLFNNGFNNIHYVWFHYNADNNLVNLLNANIYTFNLNNYQLLVNNQLQNEQNKQNYQNEQTCQDEQNSKFEQVIIKCNKQNKRKNEKHDTNIDVQKFVKKNNDNNKKFSQTTAIITGLTISSKPKTQGDRKREAKKNHCLKK